MVKNACPFLAGAALNVFLIALFSCSSPTTQDQEKMHTATQQALKDRSHINWQPLPTWGETSPTPSPK
jgi:hypothetical protein